MTDSEASSRLAMGTVGPAVIGTAPRIVTGGLCTTSPWTAAACPCGLKARSWGVFGPLVPPTFCGVQIWPVLGSRNCGWSGVAGAWAKPDDARATPRDAARDPRRSVSVRRTVIPFLLLLASGRRGPGQ